MQKYYKVFMSITIISIILLVYVFYKDSSFKKNPLSLDILNEIKQKEKELKYLVYKNYGIKVNIPIIIDDKIDDNLYGYATYKNDNIRIVLNKKRFQETKDYMIKYVLPHEYAHAMMFVFGDRTHENGGHTKKWQDICMALNGIKCNRFVQRDDILMEKVRF